MTRTIVIVAVGCIGCAWGEGRAQEKDKPVVKEDKAVVKQLILFMPGVS